MIRLLKRRLIIPRGDSGSFSIPTLGAVEKGDIAVFGIFDALTHETIVTKAVYATSPSLTFTLKPEDTINLEPKKYNWDVTIYKAPEFDEDGILIGAAEANSYYSAFKLPVCEIKEVVLDMSEQRRRTRELLLDAENPSNPTNYVSVIKAIYPWENVQTSFLAGQLYTLAKMGGYNGSIEDFSEKFGSLLEQKAIDYANRNDFPDEGVKDHLYFAIDEKILYYWDNNYYPVQATLIEGTTIKGGEA